MARVDLSSLDRMRLVGDEDCGVGLDCDDCWRGGKAIAYYGGISPAYVGDDEAVQAATIAELVMTSVHRDVPATA